MRKALSVERKMAVALWRLATVGYTWRSTALQFDVGRATVLRAKQELSNKLVRIQFFFVLGVLNVCGNYCLTILLIVILLFEFYGVYKSYIKRAVSNYPF